MLNFNHDPKLVVVRDTVISGNTAVATSKTGSARAMGGGLVSGNLLRHVRVRVRGNAAKGAGC